MAECPYRVLEAVMLSWTGALLCWTYLVGARVHAIHCRTGASLAWIEMGLPSQCVHFSWHVYCVSESKVLLRGANCCNLLTKPFITPLVCNGRWRSVRLRSQRSSTCLARTVPSDLLHNGNAIRIFMRSYKLRNRS